MGKDDSPASGCDGLLSGVVVGMIMIPVVMAYAQMAGVPPQAVLYAVIVGMTAYAIFATSRHLKMTTSSTMSIMSLAVVVPWWRATRSS